MTSLAVVALLLTIAVAAEIVLPGRDLYHSGWYNVSLAALVIGALVLARRQAARSRSLRARIWSASLACGVLLIGIAGIASGLLAPDNRTVIGAPGQSVPADDLGANLAFPLTQPGATDAGPVLLVRRNRAPLAIGPQRRDVGTFILRTSDRTVVFVQAYDARGAHLTITQPAGVSFLSPVLLMQQRQVIAGLNLPFDSFAVPAAHRIVKAVLFTAQQAAGLRGMAGLEIPAVLFAVDDENDRPLSKAIALAVDGQTIAVGGLKLRAVVLPYPSVEIVAAPSLTAVVLGALLVIGGTIASLKTRSPT
ncbi:MAG: hypothetical protein JO092_05075 [Candidatus Eremiobacteraeota bacterium]|nr:hypothetical protein [Candidatus Eremiobacteraeota bacterium]